MTADSRFRSETLVVVGAVERAFEFVRARTGADELQLKGPRDLVTGTDVAVEDAIRKEIAERIGLPVEGEECGGRGAATGGAYWLIDPICGTRNFASDIPLYCVNVALIEDGEVTVAVTGDPPAGEICVAEHGQGAWARRDGDWRRLAVSDHSHTIVIEDSHADPDVDRRERAADAVAATIRAFRWDIRALSTTLALPYLATGRIAAYALFWMSAIHVAAGSLLATEAGAAISDIDGAPWSIDSDSIVASATPALHADLLAITKPRSKRASRFPVQAAFPNSLSSRRAWWRRLIRPDAASIRTVASTKRTNSSRSRETGYVQWSRSLSISSRLNEERAAVVRPAPLAIGGVCCRSAPSGLGR